jgi:hypothetical protein
MAKDDDLITQGEAAQLRGVTPQAISELVRRGRLRSVERFGLRLVYRSEVLAFEPKTHKSRGKKAAKKGKGKK